MGHFSTSWSSQLLCTQLVGLDPYPLCHAAFSEILAVRLGRRLFSLPDILITYSLTTPPSPCVFNLIDLKVRTHFICLQDLLHLNEVLFFFNSAVIRPFSARSFLSSSSRKDSTSRKVQIPVSNILNILFPFILFPDHSSFAVPCKLLIF